MLDAAWSLAGSLRQLTSATGYIGIGSERKRIIEPAWQGAVLYVYICVSLGAGQTWIRLDVVVKLLGQAVDNGIDRVRVN